MRSLNKILEEAGYNPSTLLPAFKVPKWIYDMLKALPYDGGAHNRNINGRRVAYVGSKEDVCFLRYDEYGARAVTNQRYYRTDGLDIIFKEPVHISSWLSGDRDDVGL